MKTTRCLIVIAVIGMTACPLGGCSSSEEKGSDIASTPDAASPDASSEAGVPDATPWDGSIPDSSDGAPADSSGDQSLPPDAQPSDAQPSDSAHADAGFEANKLHIRVGPAVIVRGPVGDELDTQLNAVHLASGSIRAFTANATTYAVDASDVWHLSGARVKVLAPGPPGSSSACGRWLNGTHRVGSDLFGFVHVESACDYAHGQTHKAMHVGVSHDEGLHWTMQGAIIEGTQAPATGKITGEGDGAVIDGQDGYLYMYLLRNSDWRTIVARAPVADVSPGKWTKLLNGTFSSPGLGGDADVLGALGQGAGYWTPGGQALLLDADPWFHGLKLSFAGDKVTFATLDEPLIPIDGTKWARPDPTDLIAYPSLINPTTGSRQLGERFVLAHVYLMPGETFAKRYLVLRTVHMWQSPSEPKVAHVGIALTRYHTADSHLHWTTTAPVPVAWGDYEPDVKPIAYLLTKAHPSWASTKLEECVSDWPGHPDHIVSPEGICEGAGYTRMRSIGWVLKSEHPGTVPVYRCYNKTYKDHFLSTDQACEGLGDKEFVMGWAIAS